jgi:hypothetical protein
VVPNGLLPVQTVRAAAASSAGGTDARRAFDAFVTTLGRDDAAGLGVVFPAGAGGRTITSGPGVFVEYRASDVFTSHFVRTCGTGGGGSAYGTVTTWAVPRDGILECGTTDKLPAHVALAGALACPRAPRR